MTSSSSSSRVYRLCLKELRESLRDRRTIVTLVLMPLLVYPLLSMILQRLLLTAATSTDVPTLSIGLEDAELLRPLEASIEMGRHVLASSGDEILSVQHPDAPPNILTGENAGKRAAVQHIISQKMQFFHVERDGKQMLLSGAIDVLIRGKASAGFAPLTSEDIEGQLGNASTPSATGDNSNTEKPNGDKPDGDNSDDKSNSEKTDSDKADRDSSASERTEKKSDASDVSGLSNPAQAGVRPRRSEILRQILREMPEDRYTIEYVPDDRHSELAVQILRSLFAAVNDETSRQLIGFMGAEMHPRVSMSAVPIKMPSSGPTTLASLVPLVLVLMTIAGAVYPAIDLTAGERERGTLEAMIVSPTPRPLLLFAKYVAVVTVALLTAIANLLAMSITLWTSGLGRLVFGNAGLSFSTVVQILCLLVLFAMFFSAVLLSITSFARSFKEAQAYLIPVMLVSLAPGVLSLLPQVRLNSVLAAVPLANIVLLSRDVLVGGAVAETATISIICTFIYAIAAIAVASRLFGSDASMQGSQGSWRDLFRLPSEQMGLPRSIKWP